MSRQQTYIDKELLHGNAKRYDGLPIYDPQRIGDYNGEGFDSCESEDFDYPHGGTTKAKVYPVPGPPEMEDKRTAKDFDNLKYFFETPAESEERQNEYLKSKGII